MIRMLWELNLTLVLAMTIFIVGMEYIQTHEYKSYENLVYIHQLAKEEKREMCYNIDDHKYGVYGRFCVTKIGRK